MRNHNQQPQTALTVLPTPSRFEAHAQATVERARMELAALMAKEAIEKISSAASLMATASVQGQQARAETRNQYLAKLRDARSTLDEILGELS